MKTMKSYTMLFAVLSLFTLVASLFIALSFVGAMDNGALFKKYAFPRVVLEKNQQAQMLIKNISATPLWVLVRPNELSSPQKLRIIPGEQRALKFSADQTTNLAPIIEVSFEDPLTARPKSFEDPLTAKPRGFEDPLTAKPKSFEAPLIAKPLEIQLAIYDSLSHSAQPVRFISPDL